MVLGWPRLTSFPILIQFTENPVHSADRAIVLFLFEEALIDFSGRLVTIRFTVQELNDDRALVSTQRTWLSGVFP